MYLRTSWDDAMGKGAKALSPLNPGNIPVHLAAQKMGREKFYESYTLQVFENPRESRFSV